MYTDWKRNMISLSAASLLSFSFMLGGCGSGGSSSEDGIAASAASHSSDRNDSASSKVSSESSSSTASAENNTTVVHKALQVTVSTFDYVIDGIVTCKDKKFIESKSDDEGRSLKRVVYETENDNNCEVIVNSGLNDHNKNLKADGPDYFVPELKAPAGYNNVNVYTTMLDNNVTLEEMHRNYPVGATIAADYDFDTVTTLSQANNTALAKEIGVILLNMYKFQFNGTDFDTALSQLEQLPDDAGLKYVRALVYDAVAANDLLYETEDECLPFAMCGPVSVSSSSSSSSSSSEESSMSKTSSKSGESYVGPVLRPVK